MMCPVLLSSGRPPRPGARAPRAAGPRAAQTLELHVPTLIVFTHHSGKFTQSYTAITGNNDQPAKRLASSIPERQRGNNAEQYFINKECTVVPWGLKFTVLHASHGDKGEKREIITLCLPPKLPRSIRPHWNMRTCTLINTTQHMGYR